MTHLAHRPTDATTVRRVRPVLGLPIYRASHNDYEDSWLPDGQTAGTPETALDTAAGLHLADPTERT